MATDPAQLAMEKQCATSDSIPAVSSVFHVMWFWVLCFSCCFVFYIFYMCVFVLYLYSYNILCRLFVYNVLVYWLNLYSIAQALVA